MCIKDIVCGIHIMLCFGIPREYVWWWRGENHRHHDEHQQQQQPSRNCLTTTPTTTTKKKHIRACDSLTRSLALFPHSSVYLPDCRTKCHTVYHYVSGKNPFCVRLIATHYSVWSEFMNEDNNGIEREQKNDKQNQQKKRQSLAHTHTQDFRMWIAFYVAKAQN